jgi:nitrite reductase/ring-hydroxylating ferredoxin subunit
MRRLKAAEPAELPPGRMKEVELGPDEYALVANVEGRYYAMRAVCNHMGGPLAQGTLQGTTVTCPWHRSKWDVTTGRNLWFHRPLPDEPAYPVHVEADGIYIEV